MRMPSGSSGVTGKDQQVIPLKYNQLIKGNDLSTDIGLKAGDMILVP